jgi:hypothetical protein
MKIKNILILLILSTSLCGCYRNWYKPMGFIFSHRPDEGSPGFKLGWDHGCESGLATQYGGAIYMSFYKWKRDPDIASTNPDYYRIKRRYQKELRNVNWSNLEEIKRNFSDYNTIFWSAHSFCKHSVIGMLQTAEMDPPLPGEERYNPMAHSIGNVWKMTGKGDTRIGKGLW